MTKSIFRFIIVLEGEMNAGNSEETMNHPIYKVVSVKVSTPYTLIVEFDDNTLQEIDFQPILRGEIYAPLQDISLFNQVCIDPEVHTLVWPNGADFDPATLHDWPKDGKELTMFSQQWHTSVLA